MTTLAIDTSEQACSVALACEGTVIDRASEIIGRGHAERLLPLIEERLAAAGRSYKDLERIAVTTGPGTFTGLRIGLSVARGLALQADIPCVGVTGLTVPGSPSGRFRQCSGSRSYHRSRWAGLLPTLYGQRRRWCADTYNRAGRFGCGGNCRGS